MALVTEQDRRATLREFLVRSRSKISPEDVGLPNTTRRRVAGLRREEVAELAGVSADWYRWLESGRPIRVSGPFLSRLAQALRLSPLEQSTLYTLALPELYESEFAHRLSAEALALLSPVQSLHEVDDVLKQVAAAREKFFEGDGEVQPPVRLRIARSWQRSRRSGVPTQIVRVPDAFATGDELAHWREANANFRRAAAPALESLKVLLGGSGYAIALADARGRVLDMWGGRDILRRLSQVNFEPGADLSECVCGTNAIGTTLADGRPLQLIGAENYAEDASDLACTGAPIRDPHTHELLGVLDATAYCKLIHPQMISIVMQAALDIEERLAEAPLDVSRDERYENVGS